MKRNPNCPNAVLFRESYGRTVQTRQCRDLSDQEYGHWGCGQCGEKASTDNRLTYGPGQPVDVGVQPLTFEVALNLGGISGRLEIHVETGESVPSHAGCWHQLQDSSIPSDVSGLDLLALLGPAHRGLAEVIQSLDLALQVESFRILGEIAKHHDAVYEKAIAQPGG